jgi:hypothetical protein
MTDLTNNLMPENSPIATNQGVVTSYEFDANNEAIAKIRRASIGSAEIGTAVIGSANIATASIDAANIVSISANQITTGTLLATAYINVGTGSGYVRIDGVNNRIIINDGTNNRVLIGYQSSGF